MKKVKPEELKLVRSSRPGYGSENVTKAEVDEWITQAKEYKVATIICLLDDRQLAFYNQLGDGDLLDHYREAGFTVIHHPVPDYCDPPVPEKTLEKILVDYQGAKLPLLVHCSAGVDRTGAVIRYLKKKLIKKPEATEPQPQN